MSSIFITGATGFVGGSILSHLLSEYDPKTITVLVRSEDKAKALGALGVNTVIGSYADLSLLTELSSKADVVITAADNGNMDAAKALLEGQKQYHARTGVSPVLIHTSGTGFLVDDSYGMKGTDIVYSDLDVAKIKSVPARLPNHFVDIAITQAAEEGWVRAHIIAPPSIYGVATGVVADTGAQGIHAMGFPMFIRPALARGQAGTVGLGKNVWPNVHVDDLAALYALLLKTILSGAPEHGGFYFGASGEHHEWIQIVQEIATVLSELGEIPTAEVNTFSEEENAQYLYGFAPVIGGSCRADAARSRALGWKPVRTTQDLLKNVREETEFFVAQKNAAKA